MVVRLSKRINRCLRNAAIVLVGFAFICLIRNTPIQQTANDTNAISRLKRTQSTYLPCESLSGPDNVTSFPCSKLCFAVGGPPPPFPLLGASPSLPLSCLDDWLSTGTSTCTGAPSGERLKLDVVWTWVNGSDERWRNIMRKSSQEEGVFSPGFHYRSANALADKRDRSIPLTFSGIKTSCNTLSAQCSKPCPD